MGCARLYNGGKPPNSPLWNGLASRMRKCSGALIHGFRVPLPECYRSCRSRVIGCRRTTGALMSVITDGLLGGVGGTIAGGSFAGHFIYGPMLATALDKLLLESLILTQSGVGVTAGYEVGGAA